MQGKNNLYRTVVKDFPVAKCAVENNLGSDLKFLRIFRLKQE